MTMSMERLATSIKRFEQRRQNEGLKPNTVRSYTKCVRAYLEWLQARKEEPNSDNAAAFLIHLKNKDYKPSTLVLYRNSIKTYFADIGMEMAHVKLPSAKLGPPKYYPVNTFKKLYAAAKDPRDRAMLSICYTTAMRLDELRTRQMKDYNIADINKASVFVAGKTPEDTNAYLPLSETAVKDLKAYLATLPRALLPDEYVFHGKTPSIPMPDTTARDRMYALKKRAGIKEPGAWHRIRHSRATHLREQDVPLPDIQAVCRHKDPKTTMRYARATPEYVRKTLQGKDVI